MLQQNWFNVEKLSHFYFSIFGLRITRCIVFMSLVLMSEMKFFLKNTIKIVVKCCNHCLM